MDRNHIIDAYVFLRTNNHNIPDDVLNFIKDASLKAFDATHGCPYDHTPVLPPGDGDIICKGCGKISGGS